MNKLWSVLFATTIISGCVTNKVKNIPIEENDSFATRVIKYAHFEDEIEELPPGVFDEFKTDSNGTPIIDSSLIVGYSFLDWTPPAGSVGLGIGMSMLSLLPQPEKITSKNSTQILAWMPKNMAKTPEEATEKIYNIVFEATKKVKKVDDSQWTNEHNKKFFSRSAKDNNELVLVNFSRDWQNDIKIYPNLANSPQEFSGYDSWQWNQKQFIYTMLSKKPKDTFYHQPSYNYYQKLSQELPDWIHIYVSPHKSKQTGKIIRPFPAVFNKGNLHLFIKSKV